MLALFLHEIRHNTCKRVAQTLMYLPHFLAAVVICSIAYQLFPMEVRTPPCDAALSLLKNFLTTRARCKTRQQKRRGKEPQRGIQTSSFRLR